MVPTGKGMSLKTIGTTLVLLFKVKFYFILDFLMLQDKHNIHTLSIKI